MSSSRSVLHVIDSLNASGGAEQQLISNLRHFRPERLQHRLAVIKTSPISRREEVPDWVEVTTLFDEDDNVSRPRAMRQLLTLISERPPSLIHSSLSVAGLASRLAGAIKQIPVIESLVNISHEPVRLIDNSRVTRTKLNAHKLIDSLTMRRVTAFHALSDTVADSWARTIGIDRERVRVIPRSVPVEAYEMDEQVRSTHRRALLEELQFPQNSFLLLAIGRIEPQKGHAYLVRALAEVLPHAPEVRLLLVGRPGVSTTMVRTEIERLGLGDHVHLYGPVTNVRRFLAASDLFVYPSLFEGYGVALIEAMAARLPIITTAEPPMTDLIRHEESGLTVAPRSAAQLAHSIRRLYGNPGLRMELAEQAHQSVRRLPGPEEIATRFEDWYESLVPS